MFTELNGDVNMKTERTAMKICNQTDVRNSSSTSDSSHDHSIETYLVPTLMSCPLFVSMYIIYKLWKKVRRLNGENNLNSPIYHMAAFETDL